MYRFAHIGVSITVFGWRSCCANTVNVVADADGSGGCGDSRAVGAVGAISCRVDCAAMISVGVGVFVRCCCGGVVDFFGSVNGLVVGGNVVCAGAVGFCVVFVSTGVCGVCGCCANVGDFVCCGIVDFSVVGGVFFGCVDACGGSATGGRCGHDVCAVCGTGDVVDGHCRCCVIGSVGSSLDAWVANFCWSS